MLNARVSAVYTIHYVLVPPTQDDVEVKKDTERADEIRAMKKAWEDAEPGRAAKVSTVFVGCRNQGKWVITQAH